MQISFNLVWKEKDEKKNSSLEMPGIEPGAFHMQSERATTALHPPDEGKGRFLKIWNWDKSEYCLSSISSKL